MRTNRAAILTVACITGILGLAAPTVASADSSTLYVNSYAAAHCSDTGTGTQAQPFCTLTAADSAAQPGQTIQVDSVLNETARITKSGLPGQPITIKGSDGFTKQVRLQALSGQSPLTLTGVHDVVVDGLGVAGSAADPIVVQDSSQVVLDHMYVAEGANAPTAGLHITGQSNHVTVSRSVFERTHGIVVDPQVQNTTIAGNDLQLSAAGAIRVTDAPGTVVTNNTVANGCGPGIALLGASSGATVENNIVAGVSEAGCSATAPDAQIAVSAGSTAQSKVDYNIVHAPTNHADYNWAGTAYATVADFQSQTQQGAHDVDSVIVFQYYPFGDRLTDDDVAAVKSADPNAPGVPATDLLGYAPIDDPKVPTPANGNLLDRGAYQLQGLTSAELDASSQYGLQGPAPYTATFKTLATNTWPTKLSYVYDFGDGTTQTSDQPNITHVYTTPGTYRATVTVTDGLGGKVLSQPTATQTVTAANTALQPSFTTKPVGGIPLDFAFDGSASAGAYKVTNYAYDYGDGFTDSSAAFQTSHIYAEPGTYTVTLTVTDASGATAKTSQQVTAAYDPAGYVGVTPTRVVDTRTQSQSYLRLGPGNTSSIPVRWSLNGSVVVPQGATAVVLNLTATGGTDDSFLTAFPSGAKVPTSSNVNFKPGQDVSNVVTIPVNPNGSINIYNHLGTVDVVADVLGYYKPATGSNYSPIRPFRVLDTRVSNAPLGQGGVQSVQVAGPSVPSLPAIPANATAVALNVTATQGTDDSFLTVYPTGQPRPAQASNVNFKAGTDTGNQVIVPVGANGSIDIYNHVGSVHAVVDIFGYYSPDSQGKFVPVAPQRLMDTRQAPNHALGADSTLSVNGVPTNASAAVLNVTAVDATDSSFLTVFGGTSGARPDTSNLNFGPGQTVPNEVITPVGMGSFNVYNHVGSTDVIADLFGYFTNN